MVETAALESYQSEHLASHRRCTERMQAAWPQFLSKREQRLEQQRRLGEASEKVAENILEDLFTAVLDWPLARAIPCRRHSSPVSTPASDSFRMAMI